MPLLYRAIYLRDCLEVATRLETLLLTEAADILEPAGVVPTTMKEALEEINKLKVTLDGDGEHGDALKAFDR